MGSGKTTVGRLLATELGYRFFDTDVLIEQVAGQSINEIFTDVGEDAFRELETKVLAELSAYTRLVIATGGGIVVRRKNWSYLHQGLVVWLEASIETLKTRLKGDDTRPLLKDTDLTSKLQTLLEQRQSLYTQADLRISISGDETPEQIAARVMTAIPTVLKPELTEVFPRVRGEG